MLLPLKSRVIGVVERSTVLQHGFIRCCKIGKDFKVTADCNNDNSVQISLAKSNKNIHVLIELIQVLRN